MVSISPLSRLASLGALLLGFLVPGAAKADTLSSLTIQLGSWNGSSFSGNGFQWDWNSGQNGWAIGITNPGTTGPLANSNPLLNGLNTPSSLSLQNYWLYMEQAGSGTAIRITAGLSSGLTSVVYTSTNAETDSNWTLVSGSAFAAILIAAPQTSSLRVTSLNGGYTPGGSNWIVGLAPVAVVPEPSAVVLSGLGFGVLALFGRFASRRS